MKRNQNRNLGELITIFLDNGDLTEDDVMPLLKKGAASSLKEKEEDIFSQPLTEEEECEICPPGTHFIEPQESNKEEEPSKKPSMTIGCNECGNNIKI